ncbi:hypothetical protein MRB53_012731 [Persea americana]|uniref:Uncharacterized protein n=1 Tax=Persea americana TaxID=3435 RepID=A0ACC2LYP6_PERAE|nr:hypothetical protein MRB53_012731 [Persea americana]
MCWVSAAGRPFPRAALVQSANSLQVQWQSKQGFYGKEMEGTVKEEAVKGSGSVGSRPPNCARKCGGCTPCEAMQVPTTTDHLDPQYANYEPEGWKCKCGTSFFNP